MATYPQVQSRVRDWFSFVPKTCWIAHILSDNGKTSRIVLYRKTVGKRQYRCPPERRKPIEMILREFGMIAPKRKAV